MQLSYGGYLFPGNGVEVASSQTTEFNVFGRPMQRTRRITCTGRLLNSVVGTAAQQQTDLTAQELALVAALAIPNQNLLFTTDAGGVTHTSLYNAGSIGGVRIVSGPDFTTTQGPEYATIRTFTFSAEATYRAGLLLGGALIDYAETVTWSGGGPLYVVLSALRGKPQRQLIYEQTPYVAVQSGSATGYLAYPPPQPPIWPQALKKAPRISRANPTWMGLQFQAFPITWEYEFEFPDPLVGAPHAVRG